MKTTEKILQREKRELARLHKTQNSSLGSKYFFVLLVLIAVVNILDEVTSNLTVTVQSSFVTEFFVKFISQNRPVAQKTGNGER